MQILTRKCLPRIHMWANWSSARECKITSSIKIRTSRFDPDLCKDSCCSRRRFMRSGSHSEKKNRGSQCSVRITCRGSDHTNHEVKLI